MKNYKNKNPVSHVTNIKKGFSFKADEELIKQANKKYFLINGRISLSSLVEELLTQYTSK